MDSRRSYERHATCDRPAKDDWNLVEVRSNGRRRVVSSDHHAYKDYLAKPHAEPVDVLRAPVAKPVRMTRQEAQAQAINAHMGEYFAAIMAWDCWGDTSRDEALSEWRAMVQERIDDLMGVTSAVSSTEK